MDVSRFLNEELKAIDSLIIQSTPDSLIQKEYNSLDLVKLLAHAATERIVYYESKDSDFKFLGLGQSKSLGPLEIKKALKEKKLNIPFFLQGSFEDSIDNYKGNLFEWTFVSKGPTTSLFIQPGKNQAIKLSSQVFNQDIWESFLSRWENYEESPEHDEWTKWMDSALHLFTNGELEKIVLSRKKIFKYSDSVDTLHLFKELYQANQNSAHFSLYHQTNPQNVFISFTPEKLFTLKNKIIDTLSLAGSTPRGETKELDDELFNELQNSDRLIHEQDVVTNEIKSVLNEVCNEVNVSDLKVMKLPYIFHRQKDITGTLKDGVDALDLISHLHPTPAVGGLPRSNVGSHILDIEKNKRDSYAAPFGILSNDFSEFAVGIRSAKIEDNKITVYGGAGIVSGCNAEEEWNETGTKMKPFLKVINQAL